MLAPPSRLDCRDGHHRAGHQDRDQDGDEERQGAGAGRAHQYAFTSATGYTVSQGIPFRSASIRSGAPSVHQYVTASAYDRPRARRSRQSNPDGRLPGTVTVEGSCLTDQYAETSEGG